MNTIVYEKLQRFQMLLSNLRKGSLSSLLGN